MFSSSFGTGRGCYCLQWWCVRVAKALRSVQCVVSRRFGGGGGVKVRMTWRSRLLAAAADAGCRSDRDVGPSPG